MPHRTIISFGEILWDLLPEGPSLGGAPCNFAYRMHTMGHHSVIVSKLGQDTLGKQAQASLTKYGMSLEGIQQDPDFPTGTVEIQFDVCNNPDYHIVPHVAYDHIKPSDQLRDLARKADAICFGTLAQRTECSRKTLQWLLDQMGQDALVVCDINLRKSCYTRATVETSLQQAHVLKLSNEETGTLAHWFGMPEDDLTKMGTALVKTWNLSHCLITLASEGALAFSAEESPVYQPGFCINMKEPIGAGDACTAGFVDGILNNASLQASCRLGCAMGALVATQSGATEPVDMRALEHFLESAPQTHGNSRYGFLSSA
jgi:fructokinase